MGTRHAILLSALALLALAAVADAQCSSTFESCDFFFQGFRAKPPMFVLSKRQVNQLLSPPILHRKGWPVITANNNGNRSCQVGPKCSPTFFFRNVRPGPLYVNRANRLAAHPITPENMPQYQGACILLYMDNLQINQMGWLNPNDNKKGFPEDRRCVVYYTRVGRK
ncbi:hypothetical protein CLOP_g22033 [Closterium sp. NIES-67]|nr:hypothetical protein CLOP_g22033 [Closterium sp. NIES-67]